jgi:hypothetical protein
MAGFLQKKTSHRFVNKRNHESRAKALHFSSSGDDGEEKRNNNVKLTLESRLYSFSLASQAEMKDSSVLLKILDFIVAINEQRRHFYWPRNSISCASVSLNDTSDHSKKQDKKNFCKQISFFITHTICCQ